MHSLKGDGVRQAPSSPGYWEYVLDERSSSRRRTRSWGGAA